jgi:hypothetical protein
MSIAATRMYRGLDDFSSSDMDSNHLFLSSLPSVREKFHCSPHVPSNNSGHTGTISISRAWGTPATPIPLDGTEVEVHTAHNDSVTSQAIQHIPGQ